MKSWLFGSQITWLLLIWRFLDSFFENPHFCAFLAPLCAENPPFGFFLHKRSQNFNGGDLVVASLQIYSFLWFLLAIFVLYLVIFVDTFVFFYCVECLKRYTIRRFCMLIFHFCYFFSAEMATPLFEMEIPTKLLSRSIKYLYEKWNFALYHW